MKGSTIPSSKVKNVQQVVALQCGKMDDPTRTYIRHLKQFGASSKGAATWVRCPKGMFVSGIETNRALPYLSFFRLTCRGV